MKITAEIKKAGELVRRLEAEHQKAEEELLALLSPLPDNVDELIALIPHVPPGWVKLQVLEKIREIKRSTK